MDLNVEIEDFHFERLYYRLYSVVVFTVLQPPNVR